MRMLLIPRGSPTIVSRVIIALADYAPDPAYVAVAYDGAAGPGWHWDGVTATPPISVTALSDYEVAVQYMLDDHARRWGYSKGMDRAVTYVGDPHPQWNADAVVLRDWRSAVWVKSEDILAHFDPQDPPTVNEVLAQLPPAPSRPQV